MNVLTAMTWFRETQTLEVEPTPLAPAEQLAQFDGECAAAEQQFNADASQLRSYSLEHPEQPFKFRTESIVRIQTRVDPERQQLEANFRKAYAARNAAWAARATFLMESGIIR
jgi:hypothetical protein